MLIAKARRHRRQQIRGHCEVVLQRIKQPLRNEPQATHWGCGDGVMPAWYGAERFEQPWRHPGHPRESQAVGGSTVHPAVEHDEEPPARFTLPPECRAWLSPELLELRGEFGK